jgi:hypothetical protein
MSAKPWASGDTKGAAPASPPAVSQSPDLKDTDKNQTSGAEIVVVGCKLPSGLFLELIPHNEGWNPPPTGPRVRLNGSNSVDRTIHVNPRILTYGRTTVNKSFWDQWLAANKESEIVKKGFVFAEEKVVDFRAHAKEMLPERTGLEGLNPEGKDERLKNIQLPGHPETVVETDQDQLKRLQENLARGPGEGEED